MGESAGSARLLHILVPPLLCIPTQATLARFPALAPANHDINGHSLHSCVPLLPL